MALDHDPVGCDLLAGADDEQVADRELADRHVSLAPVGLEEQDVLCSKPGQRAQRGACAAFGADLEVAAGQHEGHHNGRDLEIDLIRQPGPRRRHTERHRHTGRAGVEEDECDDRPGPGRERTERDQRVHRRHAMAEALPRGDVERPAAPEDDRRRKRERQPLPVRELQRGNHRHQQHRERERRGDHEPAALRRARVALLDEPSLRQPRGVTGLLDRRDESVG